MVVRLGKRNEARADERRIGAKGRADACGRFLERSGKHVDDEVGSRLREVEEAQHAREERIGVAAEDEAENILIERREAECPADLRHVLAEGAGEGGLAGRERGFEFFNGGRKALGR